MKCRIEMEQDRMVKVRVPVAARDQAKVEESVVRVEDGVRVAEAVVALEAAVERVVRATMRKRCSTQKTNVHNPLEKGFVSLVYVILKQEVILCHGEIEQDQAEWDQ